MVVGNFISHMRLHRRRKEGNMLQQLTSILCRVLFGIAFFLTGVAVLERLARLFGSTILRGLYTIQGDFWNSQPWPWSS